MGISTRSRTAALAVAATVAAFAFTSSPGAAEGETSAPMTTAQASTAQTESAGAPISLKKFTKKRTRAAKARSTRKTAGKASLAQRANAGKREESVASRKNEKNDADKIAEAPASAKLAPQVANANALFNPAASANASASMPLPKAETSANDLMPTNPSSDPVEIAEAAEVNDIDKAAWAPKDVPKLSPAVLDSRAEMREEDSRWANTSTIGKIFVAIGALLTVGSAIRMFVA